MNANHTSTDHADASHSSAAARMSWSRLLKRVFDIDMEHRPHCGGTLKIIAALEHPPVIAKSLAHLGLVRPSTASITGAGIQSV